MAEPKGAAAETIHGLVTQRLKDRFQVQVKESERSCSLKGDLRRPGEEILAVGDWVEVRPLEADSGLIVRVLPRKNRFARRAAGPKPIEQVIAANLDLAVIVFAAAAPKPRWTMLDRYLVESHAAGIPPLICITKLDLVDRRAIEDELDPYRSAGYPVVFTSAETGEGIEEIRERLAGKISLLAGKSGVGKSSLINALLGSQMIRVAEVSRQTGKGRHTTTECRIQWLPGGGGLVDTPGAREFGLWEIAVEEIAGHFPDMREWLGSCRFGAGCTHSHEPDCGVKIAVREGRIDPRRYRSYLRLIGASEDESELKHCAKNERNRDTVEPAFRCIRCDLTVSADAPGTDHRNHCPTCLWSRHLDMRPGDRAAACGGGMEPIAVAARRGGEWGLIHRCKECGAVRVNRIAGDDNAALLVSLAARPLATPPFPLDRLESSMGGRAADARP